MGAPQIPFKSSVVPYRLIRVLHSCILDQGGEEGAISIRQGKTLREMVPGPGRSLVRTQGWRRQWGRARQVRVQEASGPEAGFPRGTSRNHWLGNSMEELSFLFHLKAGAQRYEPGAERPGVGCRKTPSRRACVWDLGRAEKVT